MFICLCSQDLLTRHKVLVAEFLEQNYDAVSALAFENIFFLNCKRFVWKRIMDD